MTSLNSGSPLLQPFPNFYAATTAVLKFIQTQLNFDLCMVARVKGSQWVVVNVEDQRYGIQPGQVFPWVESLCYQTIVSSNGSIVTDVRNSSTGTPLTHLFNIGSYIDLPLFHGDGSLFGTLCAFHPEAKPAELEAHRPMLLVLVQLIVSLLDSDLKLLQQKRQGDRQQASAWQDAATGLYNPEAWRHFLDIEDSRCHRYGREACVISLSLNPPTIPTSPQLSQTTADTGVDDVGIHSIALQLKTILREQDICAQLTTDELAILAVETDTERLAKLVRRIKGKLRHLPTDPLGLHAAYHQLHLGQSVRDPSLGLQQAWKQAQASRQPLGDA